MSNLTGRITLVTGASRGIGFASALALAKAGSHVIATARTQGGLEDLDDAITSAGGQCTLVPMDLKDGEAIDRLGGIIAERYGKLDGLFSNAGLLGDITPAPHVEPKTWDNIIAVNMTAPYRLIRSLDPLLRLSEAGRALFVSSSVARTHRAYWGAYAAAKAGMEAFVSAYAKEVEVSNVKVNLLDPGATRTAMRAKAMPGEDPATLKNPADVATLAVQMLSPSFTDNDTLVKYSDWAKA